MDFLSSTESSVAKLVDWPDLARTFDGIALWLRMPRRVIEAQVIATGCLGSEDAAVLRIQKGLRKVALQLLFDSWCKQR